MRTCSIIWLLCLLLEEAGAWGFKDGILHNSIWLGKCIQSTFVCCVLQCEGPYLINKSTILYLVSYAYT